jgi:hypothetical protein
MQDPKTTTSIELDNRKEDSVLDPNRLVEAVVEQCLTSVATLCTNPTKTVVSVANLHALARRVIKFKLIPKKRGSKNLF